MKTLLKTVVHFLAAVILICCSVPVSTSQTNPTNTFEAEPNAAYTELAQTPTAIQTVIAVATQPAATPGASFTVVPPAADEQVYIDPQGWYSVNFPADMQSLAKPNSFLGEGRLFETGFLPYMSKPINLCLWLANVESNPAQSAVNWMSPCSVKAKTDNEYNVEYAIYENILADLDHRFIYVKMGRSYPRLDSYIRHTVSWLKATPEPNGEPMPPSSEEAAFWENPATLLSSASITEYVLPPEAQVGPKMEILTNFVPQEAQPDWETIRKEYAAMPTESTVEEQLESLGYALKVVETQPNYRQQLFRDGRLLFDYVFNVSKVYNISSSTGTIKAFVVNTADTRHSGYFDSFLVVNDAISLWDYSPSDTANFAPILYQGELLWAKGIQDAGIEIRRSNRESLFTFRTYFATHLEVDSFQAWRDHWILTAGDFVIQDGEILNQKLGFQEIFEWQVIGDEPVYLFRKGSRLGLSYAGKILPLPYEDIPRGLCCGFASNNPVTLDDSMYFFGKRDGAWYYVVVKFR